MNTITEPSVQHEFYVDLQLKSWTTHVNRITQLIGSLSNDALAKEIAPGKNTGIYILGHLVAVNDGMLKLMGLGAPLYPHYADPFITSPDKSGKQFPPIEELRSAWTKVNETLMTSFQSMRPSDWLDRHTSVSPEDFAKEPHRNKLNIVISRTTHLAYHLGQLVLLKS
jgi:hypothetical protein